MHIHGYCIFISLLKTLFIGLLKISSSELLLNLSANNENNGDENLNPVILA